VVPEPRTKVTLVVVVELHKMYKQSLEVVVELVQLDKLAATPARVQPEWREALAFPLR
jgi:hypothetical protein